MDEIKTGYIIYQDSQKFKRNFYLRHNQTQIAQELNIIVDNNGKVINVFIEHDSCGQISVDLIIQSRSDISYFLKKLENCKEKSLDNITRRLHYYTVEADSEENLDLIEYELYERGYLIN